MVVEKVIQNTAQNKAEYFPVTYSDKIKAKLYSSQMGMSVTAADVTM